LKLISPQGSFSYHIGKSRTIEFHSTWTKVVNKQEDLTLRCDMLTTQESE